MSLTSDIRLPERSGLRDRVRRGGELAREKMSRMRERASDAGYLARKGAIRGSLASVAAVRNRPATFGLAALLGVAAVAVMASPALRGRVKHGAGRLLTAAQRQRGLIRI